MIRKKTLMLPLERYESTGYDQKREIFPIGFFLFLFLFFCLVVVYGTVFCWCKNIHLPFIERVFVLAISYFYMTTGLFLLQFSENFTILLFHYDGRTSEWDEFEWSKRAIHVSARKQTKWWENNCFPFLWIRVLAEAFLQQWSNVNILKLDARWYAKRFLHPDIVASYEYIFIWDEDLGVEHFNAEE